MASPGNRHCANCIGTLSFPTERNTSTFSYRKRAKIRILTKKIFEGPPPSQYYGRCAAASVQCGHVTEYASQCCYDNDSVCQLI